jgi:hypothetical protein
LKRPTCPFKTPALVTRPGGTCVMAADALGLMLLARRRNAFEPPASI